MKTALSRALVFALALSGCTPCSDGFMIVTVQFTGYTVNADHVDIETEAGTQRFFHPPGEPTQPFEVPSSRLVRVTALRGAQSIATTARDVTSTESCPQIAIDLGHGTTSVPVEGKVKNKADILFVIDDTSGPFQTELRARVAHLFKILADSGRTRPSHYHIGVVTPDLGAGPFVLGGGQCHPGGRGGKLQNVGAGATIGCMGPTQGVNFIDYDQLTSTANLPVGQDLSTTFNCMASVGSRGCGFEHPLEAAYRALRYGPPENHDFLRADALLFVFFLTEEDDCSADPQSDIFDPAKNDLYGPLMSYRCTQFGVACDGKRPPYDDTHGQLHNCAGATAAQGGKLIEVQKYIDFFRKPFAQGGVTVDPRDVFLQAITAESSMGISTALVNINPNPPGPFMPCSPPDGVNCVVALNHSCISPQNTQFFGDPAVRLNQVVRSMPPSQSLVTSVCDTSYQAALESLGQRVVSSVGTSCINAALPDPAAPDCRVIDDNTQTALPQCGQPPCWRLAPSSNCLGVCATDGAPFQQFEIVIDRGGAPPPASGATVRCTTMNIEPGRHPRCAR
jgi:hypothetical protein